MRVKCTITIDDAEFVATAIIRDINYCVPEVAAAIAGCLAAIDDTVEGVPRQCVTADLCRRCDVPILSSAAAAYDNLDDQFTRDFLLVVGAGLIDDHKRLPPNILSVPDIAAARAALQG